MNILEAINENNGAAVQHVATQFGLSTEQTKAAMSALVPYVTAGLQREAETTGEAGVTEALAKGSHESYLVQPEVLADPETTVAGNAILGHIFETKDVSRQVAAGAAQKTGISPAILQKMLPVIAAMVMGAIARQARHGGVGGAPDSGTETAQHSGVGGMLGSLLDRNHDGSVVDDLAGMIGGALSRKA